MKLIIIFCLVLLILISGCSNELHRYECYNADRPGQKTTIQTKGNTEYEFIDYECRKRVCEVVMVEIENVNK